MWSKIDAEYSKSFFFMFVYENYLHTCFFLLQKRSQDAAGGHYLAK